jgi:hypothetical protein
MDNDQNIPAEMKFFFERLTDLTDQIRGTLVESSEQQLKMLTMIPEDQRATLLVTLNDRTLNTVDASFAGFYKVVSEIVAKASFE